MRAAGGARRMIPFVRDMQFEYGIADLVSPLIRRVVANNPGPFTYLGTGTYIVGHDEVAVIDPGPLEPSHLEAIMNTIAGEQVLAILTTHTHVDHSPLANPLKEKTGALIHGRADPNTSSGFEEANEAHFRPDIEIGDGAVVSGPGWTLEAIATPGHASNHVCYALREENALFSGDHVMGWSTTVVSPPDGDMTAYYSSLDSIEARGFKTLWPTHGPPVLEVAPFIAAYRAHRFDRERQILAEIAAGRTTVSAMVPVMYAAVDPRLHPAASHSVLAHLIHLTRAGQVFTDGAPAIDSRYRLAV
jgi:glyoxylase-like metal-dependent hydrolase (beta-lactamase superfamily II)